MKVDNGDFWIVIFIVIGGFTLEACGKDGDIVALIGAAVGYYFGKSQPDYAKTPQE